MQPVRPSFRKDGVYPTLDDSFDDAFGHGLRVGYDDATESDVHNFLLVAVCGINESYKVIRWCPLLGTNICFVEEPITLDEKLMRKH